MARDNLFLVANTNARLGAGCAAKRSTSASMGLSGLWMKQYVKILGL